MLGPRGSEEARGAGPLFEGQVLVAGYLASVAFWLDQRGILVRRTVVDADRAPWQGWLSLEHRAPQRVSRGVLRPGWLCWDELSGLFVVLAGPEWTETLSGVPDTGLPSASRYLPGRLVPAPDVVAHFTSALFADPNSRWASTICQRGRPLGRRDMCQRLGRFGHPEPW